MKTHGLRLVLLVLCILLLASCAKKAPTPVSGRSAGIADLRNVPQDLNAFLGSDRNRRIISSSTQQAQVARYRSRFFSPWHMQRCSVPKSDVAMYLNRRARGYKAGSSAVKWQDYEWAAMKANASIEGFPTLAQPAITVRSTDLREMPTHEGRYSDPTPNPRKDPFDLFQYSLLQTGTPLFIAHRSLDGRWVYCESAIASGWVDARDVAPVTPEFISRWENSSFGAIVSENVPLGNSAGTASIGLILPTLAGSAVMVPSKGSDGNAEMSLVTLPEGSVESWPLPMTPANVARLGNKMLGQDYGWGGMFGLRDCSSTTRDLVAPFGIFLPRNSQAQARTGERTSIDGMPLATKEKTILDKGVPFSTIIVMPGHVVFYVGKWKGRPVIMHNFWAVRINQEEIPANKIVIGRNAVTTITPGSELPNLRNGRTMGSRFKTLTVVGGAEK